MQGTLPYIFRRLLWVPLILLVVSFGTFWLAREGPGNPIRIAQGEYRDPEVLARIEHSKGLDKPVYEQYVIYLRNLTHGDLGESYSLRGRAVSEIIFPAMWRSAQYNFIALLITMGLGIPLGIFAASHQGTFLDPLVISAALFIQSFPVLVAIPVLLYVFALRLSLVPASGWPHNCGVVLPFLGDSYSCIGVLSKEAIIPVLVLSLPGVAFWGRFTRAFTLDVLKEDYIRTARSKGISELAIMRRHVLRNALLPLTTLIAFEFVGLLEGSFFIETLTGIPGAGALAVASIGSRDYDIIMAFTLITSTAFILVSVAVDVSYTIIDPRVRVGRRAG